MKLHFRSARLDTVLDHLHDCAGVFIHANSNVPTEHTIDLWQDEPVSAAEALSLLKRVLVNMGCTLIRKGALFNIIRSQDLKKHYVPLPAI